LTQKQKKMTESKPKNKIIAYVRVSTNTQTIESQKYTILEYAQKHNLHISEFMEVEMSSRKSSKNRRIDELVEKLDAGDTIIVSELSRLGRSLGEVVQLLDTLTQKGIYLVTIKESIKLKGKPDIQTKMMTTLFTLFAEIERDLISERTKEGLAKIRASGKKLGRPKGIKGYSKLDGREEEIAHFLALGVSKASIAKITGVGRTTLFHFLKSRNIEPKLRQ